MARLIESAPEQRCVWLIGPGCAGKSTVAGILADELGYGICRGDDWRFRLARTDAKRHPTLYALRDRPFEELAREFFIRPVPEQLAAALAMYEESFELLLEDVREMLRSHSVIVEGVQALPRLVAEAARRQDVVVLDPTEFPCAHAPG